MCVSFVCSPPELQFYTSTASICVQVPTLILLIDVAEVRSSMSSKLLLLFIMNGISFHCQSITEYTLLSYISPVTHRCVFLTFTFFKAKFYKIMIKSDKKN